MSERLVTEADLGTPDIVCECGHNAQFHPGGPVESITDFHADWSQWAKGERCPCTKTKNGVRLTHLDGIVRREVAKALDSAARALPGFDSIRTHGDAAAWLQGRATRVRNGGQS